MEMVDGDGPPGGLSDCYIRRTACTTRRHCPAICTAQNSHAILVVYLVVEQPARDRFASLRPLLVLLPSPRRLLSAHPLQLLLVLGLARLPSLGPPEARLVGVVPGLRSAVSFRAESRSESRAASGGQANGCSRGDVLPSLLAAAAALRAAACGFSDGLGKGVRPAGQGASGAGTAPPTD